MKQRKKEEIEFHNKIRGLEAGGGKEYEQIASNRRFYSIINKSQEFFNNYVIQNCLGKKVLDYCCGDGKRVVFLAKNGAEAIGIDISNESIKNCKEITLKESLEEKANCLVMDAEKLEF